MAPAIKKSPPPIRGKSEKRKTKTFSRNETFGLEFKNDLQVTGFVDRGSFVPEIDEGYCFPPDETRIVLHGIQNGDRILATGHTGSGKTSLFEQIGARLNYNVFKVSFDGHLSRNDLIGEYVIRGGEMVWVDGYLLKGMREPGSIIIFDEWDTINDDTSFVVQRLLQREDGRILVTENGGEIVKLHPQNVVVATANTVGQGDDTGLYTHGTRPQNYAQLNRFSLCIRLNYLKPDQEEAILKKKFPDLHEHEAKAFVKTINKVRDGFANGAVSVPLSTRDLLNWVEKFLFIGNPMTAATYCFLNRMTIEDAEACKGIIQRAFEEA
jgi:cobaltochelatase CobS